MKIIIKICFHIGIFIGHALMLYCNVIRYFNKESGDRIRLKILSTSMRINEWSKNISK